MLNFARSLHIHLATEPVDFRKGHNGLTGVVRNHLEGEPLDHLWVFYNRRRNALKLLWWDHGGFILAHKKLARGRFKPPVSRDGKTVSMTAAELAALLEGIDLSKCTRLKRWNPPQNDVRQTLVNPRPARIPAH